MYAVISQKTAWIEGTDQSCWTAQRLKVFRCQMAPVSLTRSAAINETGTDRSEQAQGDISAQMNRIQLQTQPLRLF